MLVSVELLTITAVSNLSSTVNNIRYTIVRKKQFQIVHGPSNHVQGRARRCSVDRSGFTIDYTIG